MRQTLQTLFGFELSSGLRWIIAFAVVLLLVALLGFFLRRMSGGRLKFKGQGGGRARQPRLGVVDVYDLDRQRQLILVRRDNVEHLVMIGGASDVVVETHIVRSGGRVAVPAPPEGLAERPLALEPEQRPHLVEEPRPLPPSPVPAPAVPVDPVPPPRPQPPVAPAPLARPTAQPQPPRPAPAPIPPAVAAGAVGIGATLARDPAPAATASELGDMARQLEEALKRPFSAVRPGSAGPRPEPEAPAPAVAPPSPAPVVPPAPPVAAKPAAPAPARPALDMEAELEMALGLKPAPARPAAAEAPLVAPPVFAPPKPPVAEPAKSEEKKPASDKEQVPPAPVVDQPKPAKFTPIFDDVLDDEPDAAGTKASESPARSGGKSNEPKSAEAKPADARSGESKPAEAKPEAEATPVESKPAAKPPEDDPFSVDAIEAEFARLLGRDPKPKG